ncbi:MAG: sugar phosphate isomerase/epimerase family protein [Flavobacteriaceae bacterium]
MDKKRRKLIRNMAFAPLLLGMRNLNLSQNTTISRTRLQYSVNAYSFNAMFKSGEMTFFDMMEFAADIGLDAVDLTGYYFSSYPERPSDKELFSVKRKALELGLNITWTGIRNDFINPDEKSRKADRELIKQWLIVSSKMGASIMRIFTGRSEHQGYSKKQATDWLVNEFKICADYAKETGVLIGLQNHNEFLYHSDEVINVLKRVNSEWFGLILDIGSLHSEDTYEEIKKLAPYANYWLIKEHVFPNGTKQTVDMKKIAAILKNEDYRGYVSFESLSDGDPKEIVSGLFDSFRNEFEKIR